MISKNNTSHEKFNQKELHHFLTKFFVDVNIAYRIIKKSFFFNFVDYLRREIEFFDRIKFVKFIFQNANIIKTQMLKNLKSNTKIFIVCDV